MNEEMMTDDGVVDVSLTPYTYSEAPGVAWCRIFSPDGVEVSLTVRAVTLRQAIDELVDGLQYAVEAYGFRLRYEPETLQAGGELQQAEEDEDGGRRIALEYAKHIVSRKNGRHYLVLHGRDGNDYYSSADIAGIGNWQSWPVGARVDAGKGGHIEIDDNGRVLNASLK